mmetsp:Transcript_29986/g.69171  ORF Transcript_29986/g.69171 Transcript_29986/m.69171 type:complete len:162 (+) Transcript_29986:734-1219(+)
MTVLQDKGGEEFDLNNVLVEVHSSTRARDVSQELFTEINKAEPIKLVDMPGVATKGEQKIINEAASRLQKNFPEMFKPSQQCRAPHLNIDNLRDALFGSEILQRHQLKSSKQLLEWIIGQNESLGKKFQNEETRPKVNPTALDKAIKNDFYLGLDPSWLYH